jgi:hypothetical protein
MALGDLDGDGDLDWVFGHQNNPSRVYLNNGNGVFTDSGWVAGSGTIRSVALGDVDGDGDLDLVNGMLGPNRVYMNLHCRDAGDFDNDGLPTNLELANSLNPANPSDAAADDDGDSHSVRDEVIAGTQWTNGASYFKLKTAARDPAQNFFTFEFSIVSGRVYSIDSAPGMRVATDWQHLFEFTAFSTADASMSMLITNGEVFRVNVKLAP